MAIYEVLIISIYWFNKIIIVNSMLIVRYEIYDTFYGIVSELRYLKQIYFLKLIMD